MREILVTLISAQNLKKVSTFGKMTVYCVAWINPTEKVSSPLDKQGNLNPTWNATLKLMADERVVEDGNAVLTVDLYDHGTFGNTHVGSSTIPLSGLKVPPPKVEEKEEESGEKVPSTEASSSSSSSFMAVPVMRKSGKARGTLNLSVTLGELLKYAPQPAAPAPAMPYIPNKDYAAAGAAPVYAYPAATGYPPAYGVQPQQQPYYQQQQATYYPQAPVGPYQQAPPAGYYQQAPAPYYPPGGYAPPPPPRRSNGLGGGLGAGLVGGALGGLLIGSLLGGGCGGGCGGACVG